MLITIYGIRFLYFSLERFQKRLYAFITIKCMSHSNKTQWTFHAVISLHTSSKRIAIECTHTHSGCLSVRCTCDKKNNIINLWSHGTERNATLFLFYANISIICFSWKIHHWKCLIHIVQWMCDVRVFDLLAITKSIE